MSEAERKAFSNLILLCLVHHKRVDRTHPDDYTPEILHKWKSDREADGQDALAGLIRLTEDGLEKIIVEAFQTKQDQIIEILKPLEVRDKEAADLLREMMGELELFRESSVLFDPDSASKLYRASLYLAELNLAHTASKLTTAVSGLETLQRTADHLQHLIVQLKRMEGR
ncbi:MAG: hypothetical protein JO115_05200 [Pseudonocardiales bacterium]|nr:hypothetical protein [Pseudonocardiales bacterium]